MFVRRAMSRRILGVGIVLGGLIVLAIALIIGIGFPKFVYESNLKAVCVQDASHPRYKLWVCSPTSLHSPVCRPTLCFIWLSTTPLDFE